MWEPGDSRPVSDGSTTELPAILLVLLVLIWITGCLWIRLSGRVSGAFGRIVSEKGGRWKQMFGARQLVVFVWRKWRSAGEVLLCGGSGWWWDKPSPLLLPHFPSLPGFDWFLLLSGWVLNLHKSFYKSSFCQQDWKNQNDLVFIWSLFPTFLLPALFLFIIPSRSKRNKPRLSSWGPSE